MLRGGGLAGAVADLGVAVQHSRGHDLADWTGLRAWFGDVDGRRSEVSQLRDATMRALQSLLANAKRMIRSVGQGASRRRELLRLAAWLDATDEDTAADLFTSAFGIYPARHLGIAADAQAVVAATTSWWPAPAVEVPVSLRDRGVRAARGRVSGIADRSAQRQALIDRAAEEQRLRAAAAAELLSAAANLGAVRLSAPAIRLLLELMAQALGAGDPELGNAVASNLDLSVRCELISKPRHEMTLRSATGDLTTQDVDITITRLEPTVD
jgi:uncharacterized protein (TIGR02677 family)